MENKYTIVYKLSDKNNKENKVILEIYVYNYILNHTLLKRYGHYKSIEYGLNCKTKHSDCNTMINHYLSNTNMIDLSDYRFNKYISKCEILKLYNGMYNLNELDKYKKIESLFCINIYSLNLVKVPINIVNIYIINSKTNMNNLDKNIKILSLEQCCWNESILFKYLPTMIINLKIYGEILDINMNFDYLPINIEILNINIGSSKVVQILNILLYTKNLVVWYQYNLYLSSQLENLELIYISDDLRLQLPNNIKNIKLLEPRELEKEIKNNNFNNKYPNIKIKYSYK